MSRSRLYNITRVIHCLPKSWAIREMIMVWCDGGVIHTNGETEWMLTQMLYADDAVLFARKN